MRVTMSPDGARRRLLRTAALALAMALGPSLAATQPASAPSGTPPASAPSDTRPARSTRQIAPVLPETEIVRSPDSAPPTPRPPTGLPETSFPAVGDGMSKLPPFFRDTDLNVRF